MFPMSPVWALQDAKNSFSEVVERACSDVPQIVTKRGKPAVVVLSYSTWRGTVAKRPSLLEALRRFPGGSDDIDFVRDRGTGREVAL